MLIINNKPIKLVFNSNKLLKNIGLIYSNKSSCVFIKGLFGVFILKLPSFYYNNISINMMKFGFISKFFFKSFIYHMMVYCNYVSLVFFVKLRLKGLGYKVRQLYKNLYYFFFNYTNFFYFYVPSNVLLKSYRKRILLISSYWNILKLVVSHILLLKKLGPYGMRGIRLVKHIRLLKKSGKKI